MELNRAEIKSLARHIIRGNYWNMVIAGVVMSFSTQVLTLSMILERIFPRPAGGMTRPILILGVVVSLILIVFRVFVKNPLHYGATEFFIKATDGKPGRSVLTDGFRQENMKRAAVTFLMKDAVIMILNLLLLIPGLIFRYRYYFVGELLVDHPELSGTKVLSLSAAMTRGRRKELFVLDISFILWVVGSVITYELLGVTYLFPYYYLTRTLYYRELVKQGCDPLRPKDEQEMEEEIETGAL